MSRLIGPRGLSSPPTITPVSRLALCTGVSHIVGGNAGSGLSPWSDGADFVLAFPFVLEVPTTFYKVFWVNGTAAGGNSDVAIYDADGNFLVGTGAATAGSGNSLPQSVALSATTILPPGQYYAGMTHNATTTNQLFRYAPAVNGIMGWMMLGCFKSSATDVAPLADNLTPADITNVAFPMFGLITRSIFDV